MAVLITYVSIRTVMAFVRRVMGIHSHATPACAPSPGWGYAAAVASSSRWSSSMNLPTDIQVRSA